MTFTYAEIPILGSIGWLLLWKIPGGYSALSNKLLYFPLVFTPLVLLSQIAFLIWHPYFVDFNTEEALVTVIERNNQQLITATFGILVLAATFANFKSITIISREFLLHISFSLICSVMVLELYWFPTSSIASYFVLRHLKTIPYTYSIGFLLSGVLVLIQEVLEFITTQNKS